VESATRRVELERANRRVARDEITPKVVLPAIPRPSTEDEDYQSRAVREGQRAKEIALAVLKDCGFTDIKEDSRFRNGVEVNFVAADRLGRRWFFDVSGAFSSSRAGLKRTDTLWKALGKASVLNASNVGDYKLIFLTTDLPPRTSAGGQALRAAHGRTFHDAIAMLSREGQARLSRYAAGEARDAPLGELLLPPNNGD
jgi:hypothetical protein